LNKNSIQADQLTGGFGGRFERFLGFPLDLFIVIITVSRDAK